MTPLLYSYTFEGGSMDGRRHRGKRGFSVVEALIGITLFAMALMAFFAIFPYSLQTTSHDDEYLQAISAGQQYLDALRAAVEQSQPLPGPPSPPIRIDGGFSVTGNGVQNASPGNFTIVGSCALVPGFTRLDDCTVTVTWNEGSLTRTYQVESYATQQVS
jgi:type II secretory pathway component PulJ